LAGPLPIKDVIAALLKGVVEAHKAYEAWSDEWLWQAPEYFTTVFIARELGKLKSAKYVTLENSAKAAIEDARARGRGRLHSELRAKGRFDILLWWGNGTPRAPIEVKSQVLNIGKISSDVKRISQAVTRKKSDSSIAFGAVVFYSSCNKDGTFAASERLQKSLDNILRDAKKLVADACHISMKSSQINEVADSAWVAAALILSPKNG
jgi:hypothetical protein